MPWYELDRGNIASASCTRTALKWRFVAWTCEVMGQSVCQGNLATALLYALGVGRVPLCSDTR